AGGGLRAPDRLLPDPAHAGPAAGAVRAPPLDRADLAAGLRARPPDWERAVGQRRRVRLRPALAAARPGGAAGAVRRRLVPARLSSQPRVPGDDGALRGRAAAHPRPG